MTPPTKGGYSSVCVDRTDFTKLFVTDAYGMFYSYVAVDNESHFITMNPIDLSTLANRINVQSTVSGTSGYINTGSYLLPYVYNSTGQIEISRITKTDNNGSLLKLLYCCSNRSVSNVGLIYQNNDEI